MTAHPTDRSTHYTADIPSPSGPPTEPVGTRRGGRLGAAELATARMRAAAWAIDLVVVAVLTAVLVIADIWFLRDVLQLTAVWDAAVSWPRKAIVVAIATAVATIGYLGLGQAGSGRSIGKRLVGLRAVQMVRMPDGGLRMIELRIRVAVLRQVAHVVDLPLGWGFLRPAWDRYRRTKADEMANVFVVVDRDERCFEHEKYLDKGAGAQQAWWLCKQADEEIWRGEPRA
jgi:hypothetical protein